VEDAPEKVIKADQDQVRQSTDPTDPGLGAVSPAN
jgi:hypothetical protein